MSAQDIIQSSRVKWMDQEAGSESIVISSRVRLARNLTGLAFPNRFDERQAQESMERISAVGRSISEPVALSVATFDELDYLQRQILLEKQLISPEHAQSAESTCGVMLSLDGAISIMINEEDHLRVQSLLPGLQIERCWQAASQADDWLERQLDYAFDEKWGYLTSCPTNLGTGMRASVMMHLPALQMSGQGHAAFQRLAQLGLAVRGIYGEGSEAVGNFYQISNQLTMGQTEEGLCQYLTGLILQVVSQEKMLRQQMLQGTNKNLEDRVGRAFGVLHYARVISSNEALNLLSDLRLGVDMGLIQGISPAVITELMIAIRPAHLQQYKGQAMQPQERDALRAELIQEKLRGSNNV